MVIDMLNMAPQVALQREAFGDLSDEIDEYKQRQLDRHLHTPRGQALRRIVDPYEYRDALTQPKLVILGANDRYWPLDAEKLYFDDLAGQKHLLRIPNNGHNLKDYGRIVAALNALHQSAMGGQPLPKLAWKFDEAGGQRALRIESDPPASRVRAWHASAKSRDFRDCEWTATDAREGGGAFVCPLQEPASGFAALYGEVVFHSGKPGEFSLTTSVRIFPAQAATAEGGK
jgi:PhoPQ-activated pathogenicity-related protein